MISFIHFIMRDLSRWYVSEELNFISEHYNENITDHQTVIVGVAIEKVYA